MTMAQKYTIIINALPGTIVGLHRMALQPLPFAIGIESCPELNRGGRQHTLEYTYRPT